MKTVRSVAFANYTELQVDPGAVLPGAIALGDVDNDSNIELVVGCMDGTLLIYKGCETSFPKYRCCIEGSITCVVVGDIWDQGYNSIIVIIAEGKCLIFDITDSGNQNPHYLRHDESESPLVETGTKDPSESSPSQSPKAISEKGVEINPSQSLDCPCNVRTCLLEDLYQIGSNVMLLGSADSGESAVYVYQFDFEQQSEKVFTQYAKWKMPGDVFSLSSCMPRSSSRMNVEASEDAQSKLRTTRVVLVGLMHGECGMIDPQQPNWVPFQELDFGSTLPSAEQSINSSYIMRSATTLSNRYEQGTNYSTEQLRLLRVPTFVVGGVASRGKLGPFEGQPPKAPQLEPQNSQRRMSSESRATSQTSGSVSGNTDSTEEELVVVCSVSGYFSFHRLIATYKQGWSLDASSSSMTDSAEPVLEKNGYGKIGEKVMETYNIEKVWDERTDSRTLALFAEDITGDNSREIVTCCWDGLTFVHDQEGNVLRFRFPGRVQAFLTGKYSVENGVHNSCFVYVTFDGRIILYTEVAETIRAVPSRTIVQELESRKELNKVIKVLHEALPSDLQSEIKNELRNVPTKARAKAYNARLIHECLYGRIRHKIKQKKALQEKVARRKAEIESQNLRDRGNKTVSSP